MAIPHYSRREYAYQGEGWYLQAPYSEPDNCPQCAAGLLHTNLMGINEIACAPLNERLMSINRSLARFYSLKCSSCGWWQVRQKVCDGDSRDYGYTNIVEPKLKIYNPGDHDVPICALAEHLKTHKETIYGISPLKMEELVQAVFKEHYDCEVIHCGRSGDMGIDLLLIQGQELIPVQVKRRIRPGSTESPKIVREMLGVMYRDRSRRSIVVSTAKRFSPSGMSEAKSIIEKGLADSIELIDCEKFISILRNYYYGQEIDEWSTARYLAEYAGEFAPLRPQDSLYYNFPMTDVLNEDDMQEA